MPTSIVDLVVDVNTNGVVITASTEPGYLDPTKYNVVISKGTDQYETELQNFDTYTQPITVSNLLAGTSYLVKVTPYLDTTPATARFKRFNTLASTGAATVSSTRQDFKISKSYAQLSITEAQYAKKQSAVLYRNFDSIYTPSLLSSNTTNGNSWDTGYFSFGTSILMDNNLENTNQSGGIGFFLNESGTDGYYLIIESTTSASAILDKKSVRLEKWVGGTKIPIKEIGTRTESTIEGIYGGRTYNLDLKVKISNQTVSIDAFINGYRISATDSTYKISGKVQPKSSILTPTKKIGLICSRGQVAFDYAYANTLKDYQYNDRFLDLNIYQGQFNNDLINSSYGDIVYMGNYTEDEISSGNKKETSVDEFGTVIREIIKTDVSFTKRPSYPVKWSTGINPYAKILGQKLSNFGSEAYILNNTSTTIPLSNGAEASLVLWGNDLGDSGELVYSTDELNDYIVKEPVTFKSYWLQNESDVKALANWIKSHVVNKGKVVTMKIFGSPLISVGDMVSIKNTYNSLDGTENFIITEVKHSYSEGLETIVTCRTL